MPADPDAKITITKDGPYHVSGNVPISREAIGVDADGESERWVRVEDLPEKPSCGLCRCGASDSKPYCDGSHLEVGFVGTEVADTTPYEQAATVIEGPRVNLMDQPSLCAEARFCHRSGAAWHRVNDDDDASAQVVIEECALCPSGRYTAVDKTSGERIEPQLEQSIAVTDDPHAGCAGPLWVRGGLPVIGADGTEYEVRNRVTLCRCGQSSNKPFCDGSHVTAGFRDGGHDDL